MSKVLITGSSGFIGKKLCSLLEKNHELIRLSSADGDISDPSLFKNIEKVDYVFHLAARSFVPASWKETTDFIDANVLGTTNVLEFCRRTEASITFVSSYVYGPPEHLPIKENHPVKPNNPYALSKVLAEQVCKFYSEFHGTPVTIIRPFNIYGPGQSDVFLIPKIIDQIKRNNKIELMDLSPKRDYVFLDDFLNALILTLQNREKRYKVFNVGSGVSYSVKEVVDIIQKVAKTELEVISLEKPRNEELNNVYADITSIKNDLNWYPTISLKKGIEKIFSP